MFALGLSLLCLLQCFLIIHVVSAASGDEAAVVRCTRSALTAEVDLAKLTPRVSGKRVSRLVVSGGDGRQPPGGASCQGRRTPDSGDVVRFNFRLYDCPSTLKQEASDITYTYSVYSDDGSKLPLTLVCTYNKLAPERTFSGMTSSNIDGVGDLGMTFDLRRDPAQPALSDGDVVPLNSPVYASIRMPRALGVDVVVRDCVAKSSLFQQPLVSNGCIDSTIPITTLHPSSTRHRPGYDFSFPAFAFSGREGSDLRLSCRVHLCLPGDRGQDRCTQPRTCGPEQARPVTRERRSADDSQQDHDVHTKAVHKRHVATQTARGASIDQPADDEGFSLLSGRRMVVFSVVASVSGAVFGALMSVLLTPGAGCKKWALSG